MSDFLSRLAARAVRDVPRTASPVHEAAQAVAQAELPVARALPSAPEVRAEAPEVVRARPEERDPAFQPSQERLAARVSSPASTGVAQGATTPPSPPPDLDTGEASPEPVAVSEPVPVVTAVPVPAAPTIERRVESRIHRMHTVETVAADEPPVRVHIGRLEVRANLEQQPQRQPKREPAKPQGGTLADYLRGKRTA